MTTFSTNNFFSSGRSFSGGSFRGPGLGGSFPFSKVTSGGGRHSMVARAPSMHGGSGGSGVRISSVSSSLVGGVGATGYGFSAGSGGGFGFGTGSGIGLSGETGIAELSLSAAVDGKITMKNLNDRLATYIGKVRSLENANDELELKIRQLVESKTSLEARDYFAFQDIIRDLQDKIQEATRENGNINLSIDNAKLAADDFRNKYENELTIRQSVESDIAGLKRLLNSMTLEMSDLEMKIEVSKEDMAILEKTHKEVCHMKAQRFNEKVKSEDLEAMRTEMSGKVNVEVKVEPSGDIQHVLAEIREQYETVVAKKQREVETWFQNRAEALNDDMANNMSNLESSKSEVTEIRRTLQGLEIELQSQVSMKASLEDTLANTQARYSIQLSGLQAKVTGMEQQLTELKADVERQAQEYKMLLDIKTKLEMEITEYQRLLDGSGSTGHGWSAGGGSNAVNRVNGGGSGIGSGNDMDLDGVKPKVKMIVEEMVDGKVVSTDAE